MSGDILFLSLGSRVFELSARLPREAMNQKDSSEIWIVASNCKFILEPLNLIFSIVLGTVLKCSQIHNNEFQKFALCTRWSKECMVCSLFNVDISDARPVGCVHKVPGRTCAVSIIRAEIMVIKDL